METKETIEKKKNEHVHREMLKEENLNRKKEKIAPENICISLQHINKIYPNHVQAVFDFNLDIKEKEFIVFVGPSGCGKSTTLRMIAGLEEITYGDLYIAGRYANDLLPKERDIAMVFQNYALYPNMTVYKNLAFSLKVRHVDKNTINERVTEAAKILEIEDYLNRRPAALSGGQRQRVALGRSIVRHAKVMLMDEPLSNLDAKLRVQMRSEIVKLHKRVGSTTIYVTHDQTEAMTMATRIVVMKLGYVQQIGTPKEIYNNPANIFVATFIGSPAMNILNATVSKSTITLENGFKIPLSEPLKKAYTSFYHNMIESIKAEIKEIEDKIETRRNNFRDYETYKDEEGYKKFVAKYDNKINALEGEIAYINSVIDDTNKAEAEIKISKLRSKIEILKAQQEVNCKTERAKVDARIAVRKAQGGGKILNDQEVDAKMERDDLANIYYHDLEVAQAKLEHFKDIPNQETVNVKFGVRPEDIIEVSKSSFVKNPSKPFSISVTVAELLGNEYYVHSDIGKQDFIAKISTSDVIDTGDKLSVVLDLNHIHLFDEESTKRIF